MNTKLLGIGAAALLLVGCASTRHSQSTGEYLDSRSLNARLKTELLRDSDVKGTQINVNVWRNIVQLNGFVDTEDQRRRAETIAWGVRGVRDVQNNLLVRQEVDAVGGPATAPQIGSATDQDAEIIFSRVVADPTYHYGERLAMAGRVDTIFSPQAFTLKSLEGVVDRRILVLADRETVSRLTPEDPIRVVGQLEPFDRDRSEERLGQLLRDERFDDWRNQPALFSSEISAWNIDQPR